RLDANNGVLELLVDAKTLAARETADPDLTRHHQGAGREIFSSMRLNLSSAVEGACSLFP
ncbi:MAG: hypothetical protein WD601_01905, partial [Pseudohongiellaceae bacterium]